MYTASSVRYRMPHTAMYGQVTCRTLYLCMSTCKPRNVHLGVYVAMQMPRLTSLQLLFTAFSLVPKKINPNSIANITFMSGQPRP